MGEPSEDLLPTDPLLGEVDRFGWPGVGLSRRERAKGTVRRRQGCVVVPQVLGQHLAQVVLVDNQQPVEELSPRVPIILSQMAFALGARGGTHVE